MAQCVKLACATTALTAAVFLLLSPAAEGCSDRDPRCSLWAGKGECYKNRGYMHVHCAESCHQCVVQDNSCQNVHEQCEAWSGNGECQKNYAYMRKVCARACTFCQPANDHSVPHVHANFVDEYWKKFRSSHPEIGNSHHS
ncbi:putative tyrosinase-like protein tyr-3 [Homarus americanus]|uniref:putative tyrosinase-like protein tyr-3 n=1 Tax=Homarus americanus TaxID=6706 RepID=UPI001C44D985|nr:putative tyrosinase-like protein tyr-3 [Homarus americanus]